MKFQIVLLLAKALIVACSLSAYGQPVVRITQKMQRCGLLSRCQIVESSWSGTLIGRTKNDDVAIVTCAHVVERDEDGQGEPQIEIESGVWITGRWIVWDRQVDVGVIVCQYGKSLPCSQIAETDTDVGGEVEFFGSPMGRPITRHRTRIVARFKGWTLTDAMPVQGQSGGPLYVRGRIVGIAKGHDDRTGFFADLASVRKTVKWALGDIPRCVTRPASERAAEIERPQVEPTPIATSPDTNGELLVRIEAALTRIEAIKATPGPTGPTGPKGDAGPAGVAGVPGERGSQGPAGKDADLTEIEAIKVRLARLEDVRIPLVVVQPDGTEIKQTGPAAKLGEPLKLYLSPKKKE